jgi:RNA-directed DNA polymerase
MSDISELKAIETFEQSTPQGSVISPLLCNIAFIGFEKFILKNFGRDSVKIIRYADDFLIMGSKLKNVEKAKKLVEIFLKTVGLELSSNNARVGHTLLVHEKNEYSGKPGFEFLGFYFRN